MIVFGLLRGGIYGNAHVDFLFSEVGVQSSAIMLLRKDNPTSLQNSYTAANETLLVMLGQAFCALTGVLLAELKFQRSTG